MDSHSGTIYVTAVPWCRFIQLIRDPDDHDGLNPSDELCSHHPDCRVLLAVVQTELLPMLRCLSYEAGN
jgi:hypothetical protein